jgi:23S rRNA (pseudouridine1915-N3)-methyltransferase
MGLPEIRSELPSEPSVAVCLNSPVKLKVAWIGKTKDAAIQSLTDQYLKRISRYVDIEALPVANEAALLKWKERSGSHPAHQIAILDSRGKQFSSEEFAHYLRDYQDRNPQPLILAIGPADGFSDEMRTAANAVIALGKMTLAHELARVVLLEQVYRAFTILKGHPYHTGH